LSYLADINILVIRRRNVAKNVGCFQRLLFVCLWVNSKHMTMKLGG